MKIPLALSLTLVCFAISPLCSEEVPASPIAEPGKLLLSDDFSEGAVGEGKTGPETWLALIPGFVIEDGVLKAWQGRDDHGAVGRVYLPMKDVVVDFRFQLNGTKNFNVVFDDQQYKGSHAGHIARVAFAPTQIRLGDDKEGIMKNEIFEMRKDPTRKAEAEELLKGRGATVKMPIEQGHWYSVRIELIGDEMRLSLDGEPVGYLKSPGLAHETKSSFHFTVNGDHALFDDVKISQAIAVDN
jgi:hypothetical protein